MFYDEVEADAYVQAKRRAHDNATRKKAHASTDVSAEEAADTADALANIAGAYGGGGGGGSPRHSYGVDGAPVTDGAVGGFGADAAGPQRSSIRNNSAGSGGNVNGGGGGGGGGPSKRRTMVLEKVKHDVIAFSLGEELDTLVRRRASLPVKRRLLRDKIFDLRETYRLSTPKVRRSIERRRRDEQHQEERAPRLSHDA